MTVIAPTFVAAGSTDGPATGTTRAPGVPSGTVNGSMLLGIEVVVSAVDPAADTGNGFAKKYSNTSLGSSGQPSIIISWKRSTGTEGTYAFPTGSAVAQSTAVVWRVENEEDDSDPFHTSASALRTAAVTTYPTVSLTSVPAHATLVWIGAASSNRSIGTMPSGFTRLTPNDSRVMHIGVLEDYAGGNPSVSGVASTGGGTSLTSMMFAILPYTVVEHTGSGTGSWTAAGTADGDSGTGGAATGSWAAAGTATGARVSLGSATGTNSWFGQGEGPNPVTEYVEDWADLNAVNDTGVQVSGNKLYASGSTSPRGYLFPVTVPSSGPWRYQQVVYCQGGSTSPAPEIRLGVTCNPSVGSILDLDSYSMGWQLQFATRARSSFKGGNLSAVPVIDEEIAGASIGTTTGTYLFTIDADENYISFALKRPDVTQDLAVFRVSRADMADAGRAITAFYVYITDGRGTSGSSLSPFIYQTGSLKPTATKVVAGQTIEGHAQRVIATAEETGSVQDWYIALPPNYQATSPLLIHCPQSLTGDGDDFWTDSRMSGVTAALTAAGFALASSTDIADRFANEVDVQNYNSLKQWFFDHFGADRDVFLFGTSMGTLSDIVLVARGLIDARAVATIGFAGGQFWIWYNVTTKRDALRTAFGFSGTPTDPELHDYFEGYDPQYDYAGDTDFAGKGFRFYTSDSDTVTPSSLSDGMSDIVEAAGASEFTVIRASGGHLDPSQYQPTDLVDFYLRNASDSTGSATGSWSAAGTASGQITRHGSATGAWSASGSATGEKDTSGSATGSWSASGSATGGIAQTGSATGSWGAAGTASGQTLHTGAATGSWSATGAAAGTSQHRGTSTGAWSTTGSAAGSTDREGSTTGSWEADGTGSGFSGGAGIATGSWSATGSGTGEKDPLGSATGTWSAAGTGSGSVARRGTATGSWTASGTSTGKRVPKATSVGTFSVSGNATGTVTRQGAAVGSWSTSGSASGGFATGGSAVGSWSAGGSATGRRTSKATATGSWSAGGTGSGDAGREGQAVGSWVVVGSTEGSTEHSGSAVGGSEWSGVATSNFDAPCDPVATIIPAGSVATIVPSRSTAEIICDV